MKSSQKSNLGRRWEEEKLSGVRDSHAIGPQIFRWFDEVSVPEKRDRWLRSIMKDSKARGLVLKRLYDLHHQTTYVDDSEFSDLPIERNVVANILEQLDQKGLAEWEARENYMDPAERFYKFRARITAIGIDGH